MECGTPRKRPIPNPIPIPFSASYLRHFNGHGRPKFGLDAV